MSPVGQFTVFLKGSLERVQDGSYFSPDRIQSERRAPCGALDFKEHGNEKDR